MFSLVKKSVRLVCWTLLLRWSFLSIGGCTDVDLLPAQRAIAVQGDYLTNNSSVYNVPIRILLVIDTSQSMEENDPTGHRAKAAAELISQLSEKGQDIAFGFIAFNTSARQLTEGFEPSTEGLNASLSGLTAQEGFTNYLDALGLANAMIHEDVVQFRESIKEAEANGEKTRYLRPYYFTVFLSDGLPRVEGGKTQSVESILFEVEQLMELPEEAMGITLHTAFLGAKDDLVRPEAESLLRKMADKGHGTYYSFEKGDEIDFSVFEFKVKRLFDVKQFLIFNRNAVMIDDFIYPDSDSDGTPDYMEEEIGTDPLLRDTDGDGLGDGFELKVALDPLSPENFCAPGESERDDDQDFLNNCEEVYLNFDKDRFDTDGDLFPDGFELYSGGNPGDGSDVFEDLDFDHVITADEMRQRTDPRRDDKIYHDYYAYRYHMELAFEPEEGLYTYRYRVENIALTRTKRTTFHDDNENEIIIYFIESPEDDAEKSFSLYRGTIRVGYKKRSNIEITHEDFVKIASQQQLEE